MILIKSIILRDIYTKNSSIKNANDELSDLFKKYGNLNKDRKSSEKSLF